MNKTKIKERRLLREGYKLMRQFGYHGTNVETIVSNLGIAKGSFYLYYNNKEEFAEAVLAHFITAALNRVDRTLYNYTISPKQRLLKLYSDHIDHFTNTGESYYGNFASNLTNELGESNQKIKEMASTFNERIKVAHIDCLQSARRSGEVDKFQDIEKLTLLIIYSWEGALLRVNSNGNIQSLFAFREILRDFILK